MYWYRAPSFTRLEFDTALYLIQGHLWAGLTKSSLAPNKLALAPSL